MKPPRVWLPAYVCAEVAIAVPEGIERRYFPLDGALAANVDFLATNLADDDHVLAIDYFGRPVSTDFTALVRARPGIGWIEDRAQALNPEAPPWGDWILYSPRKLVGVPDGGIFVAHNKPLPPMRTISPVDFAFALPALERFEDVDEADNVRWYVRFLHAEAMMTIGTQSMSRLSMEILRFSNAKLDCEIRRRNFEILHARLQEWAFIPDAKIPFAPLGFPVRVRSSAELADRLALERIFAPRHWYPLPSDPAQFAAEHRLASELLTLPCDYRYDEADMHRVAEAVRRSM